MKFASFGHLVQFSVAVQMQDNRVLIQYAGISTAVGVCRCWY